MSTETPSTKELWDKLRAMLVKHGLTLDEASYLSVLFTTWLQSRIDATIARAGVNADGKRQ